MPINLGGGNGNVTYSNGNLYDSSGNIITGVASYTWVQFNDAGFDLTVARYVHITDRHSTTDGTSTPGSLWRVDPTATAIRKRNLVSGPIYYATYAAAIADVPVASWPNHRIWVATGCGLGGAELYNNGTRYAHKQKGRVLVASNNTRDTISTNKTTEKIECQWAIPAAFLAVGDRIFVDSRCSKAGTTAAQFLARDFHIGSAGTVADASLKNISSDTRISTSNLTLGCGDIISWVVTSATTVQRPGPLGSADDNGFSATTREIAQTIPNISGALYFSAGYWLSGGTTDTVTFEACSVYLEMGS